MQATAGSSSSNTSDGDVLLRTQDRVVLTAIALEGGDLFVARLDQTHVRYRADYVRIPASGGAETVLASATFGANHMSADADALYATTDQGLLRIPRAGLPEQDRWNAPVLSKDSDFGRLALTKDAIVFETRTHAVAMVPKSGGEMKTLADGTSELSGLAADNNTVFFARDHKIEYVGPDGALATLLDGAGPVDLGSGPIAIDDTNVYFTGRYGGLRSVPRAGGATTTLAKDAHGGCGIVVEPDRLLACTTEHPSDEPVAIVPKSGLGAGVPTPRIPGSREVKQLVADPEHVYGFECHSRPRREGDSSKDVTGECALRRWAKPK